jgi:hypothetical protein
MKHIALALLLGTMSFAEAVKVSTMAQTQVDQRLSQGLIDTVKELEQLDELTTHSLEATLKKDTQQPAARKPIQGFQNIVQLPVSSDGPIMLAQKSSKK